MASVCPTVAHLPERPTEVMLSGRRAGDLKTCPRCGSPPYAFDLLGVIIDVCTHCGGVWLDGDEYEESSVLATAKPKQAENAYRTAPQGAGHRSDALRLLRQANPRGDGVHARAWIGLCPLPHGARTTHGTTPERCRCRAGRTAQGTLRRTQSDLSVGLKDELFFGGGGAMEDLDRYLAELHALGESDRYACEDLAVAEQQPRWTPTRYEIEYLSGLRKVGLAAGPEVTLQNVADLHIHTDASDGGPVPAMLEPAVNHQLDAVAVTDHDTLAGALQARRYAHRNKLPLAVVPGVEVSTADGHVGALFVAQEFPSGRSMRETIDLIHAAGGLAVAHHPFVPSTLEILMGETLGIKERFLELPYDAVEVTNAVPGLGTRSNIRTHRLVREAGCTLGFTGGSDAHHPSQVGKGLTFFAGNRGVLSLREGIELGTTLGAEAYWTTAEKLGYYARLVGRVFAPSIPPPPGLRRSRWAVLRRVVRGKLG